MTKFKHWIRRVTVSAALALAACGGGGDGIDGSGLTEDSVSYGTITAFGSVWVNGVEFESDRASIRIDDRPGVQSDLRLGMVVRVEGSIDDRSAATITVDEALKGRVEQVIDASRWVVMGQTVLIDNQTRFDDGVRPVRGDYVEVHGLPSADGVLTAGYVQKKATLATPPFVVKGVVTNHDTAGRSFQVGGLLVTYSGADTGDMGAGIWNGRLVDAKGSTCAGNPVCGTLSASKVEPGGANVASIAKAEIEGHVTSLSANGFVLGGQTVVTTAATVYEGGLASEVLVGTKLEVEGPVAGGVLTATKVSFRDNLRLEGDVVSVDTTAGTLTLAGLSGVTVRVSPLTEWKDVATLAELAAPNHLRIRARLGVDGSVLALELERRSTGSDSRVILQGPVSAIIGSTGLTILGQAVDTSSVPDSEFKNLDGSVMGRSAFFAALRVGSLVKARADLDGLGGLRWNQVEREN